MFFRNARSVYEIQRTSSILRAPTFGKNSHFCKHEKMPFLPNLALKALERVTISKKHLFVIIKDQNLDRSPFR